MLITAKYLSKSLNGCETNKFLQTIASHLVLCEKVVSFHSKSVLSDKSEQTLGLQDMTDKDIYDERYFPPSLRTAGQSTYKFKQYFHESHYQRKPQIDSSLNAATKVWTTTCHMIEPKEVVFTASKPRKKDSEAIAMGKALMWLRDNDFVDNGFNAIKLTNKQIQDFYDSTNGPISIKPISGGLKDEMKKFCNSFDAKLKDKIVDICRAFRQKEFAFNSCDEISTEDEVKEPSTYGSVVRNVFNNTVYEESSDELIIDRELQLNSFINKRKRREESDDNYRRLREKIGDLPINKFRQQILETIEQNRVIVITGDTGCGKTTQLPQMIFESEISQQRGAFTNIVVSQPRRLPAIAISHRIASEFGEESIGNSIGYHIRFDKTLPKHSNGVILLCSAGILLRKLGSNAGLKGVSHVIIDEVHERDVITDFLLVMLKRSLNLNPNLRVILMSASMNAQLFSQYFDCPLIEVPGRCYPVNHFYLNDFSSKIANRSSLQTFSERNPKVDINMTKDLIDYIDRKKGDGAILCFLPGWAEIQAVSTELEKLNSGSNHLIIIPVHSKLPSASQQKIFTRPPVGIRKVVLSTNIAETSLTIDDVVYVIDSGLAKEMRFNTRLNVSSFGTHWISRANAKQRSGRAGRVTEGQCFRMYTRDTESAIMDEFPTAEILRVPLENVVMTAKFHCPDEPIKQFLSAVPQPPTSEAINRAIELLKGLKILDEKENLTVLGKRVVNFTSDPRLSVALVYSSFFSCVKSMLPIVSQLSTNREPFEVMSTEKLLVRQTKDSFSYDIMSDHIPYVDLTLEYQQITNSGTDVDLICYIEDNHLHRYSMNTILETMKQLASHLEESQFITRNSWKSITSDVNINWHRKYLLTCALVPAFVSNCVRLLRGEVRNQRIKDNALYPIDVKNGSKVKFTAESVFHKNFNSSEQMERLTNGILIYFKSFFSEDARMLTICDASEVSPIALLLFSNNKFEFNFSENVTKNMDSNHECVVALNGNTYLNFKVNREDMQLLSRWITILDLLFEWFIIPKHLVDESDDNNDEICSYLRDFVDLTEELLRENSF